MSVFCILVAAGEYIYENHYNWFEDAAFRAHYNDGMFNGTEFDSTMLRIAAMNLQLHGIETPKLRGVDALSKSNGDVDEAYTLVLANPPFKGSLDYDDVESSLLKTTKTKKTELLFLSLILRIMRTGGRAAVIVPDGVLFGSSTAHKAIRKELVQNQRLQAVVSMPSGVFKPYAGVSTAILFFTKTNSGGTDHVWFYDMKADGYSLDDKRSPVTANDIPDILKRFHNRKGEAGRKRTEQSFLVPMDEIKANDWDLSINRYKKIVYEEVEYDAPEVILDRIKMLDEERRKMFSDLNSTLL
ncbi:HsdM family class I SAM-dependent methyltransferase [Sinomicrobium oceani]|nr:class I SAM-dependent DNA methyltransferase [Sinomicrobium oceani]